MSQMNFDQVIDRRNTNCAKHDEMDGKYKEYEREDLIHLGVADMDFQAPEPIREELRKIVEHGIFGYTNIGPEFYNSIQRWLKRQTGEEIPQEWIVFCPRINISSSISVEALTEKGDKVLIHAPYYMPLHNAVIKNKRELIKSPLFLKDNRYEMDFEQMEKAVDEKTKMLILCNPHNPCGRSWNFQEMERLAEFCEKHNLLLFSDEIHSDIRPSGQGFVSALNLLDRFKERLIYVNSPAKTFNIPGLILSYMVIPNQELRERIKAEIDRIGMHNPTVFANAVLEAGYCRCDSWLTELNSYIDENERLVKAEMEEYMPEFRVLPREGTYLLWIDCRELKVSEKELERWFIREAGVGVYMGSAFGPEGEGFIRWNLGSPRSVLQEALDRMRKVYKKIAKETKK